MGRRKSGIHYTSYFQPSDGALMINYIVKDIEGLIGKLKIQGIPEVDKLRSDKFGKFATVMDPEGNKVEVWGPDKEVFSIKCD